MSPAPTFCSRPPASFVAIGTDEVYGSVTRGASREVDPLNPSNPYSASKAAADLLARAYWITHRLPVVVTRSSNNFGPYQYPEKMIPLFVTNALEGKPLPLYGDGKNVRDWLYVADNCAAVDLVLRKGKDGEIYNIGGSNEVENIARSCA
jgi:dTDP-glucose 4,6-dehydratase